MPLEQFLQTGTPRGPLRAREREMADEIQDGHNPHLVTTVLGAH
jgi:hypothetical protein